MALPIALQLYSVRERLAEDFVGTVKAVAEMGYVGVEPAGFPGTTAKEAASLFQDLGLEVPSCHTGMPVGEDKKKVLDEMAALGCKNIVSGKGSEDYNSPDQIKTTCGLLNEAAANAKEAGLSFGIHNHWWEFVEVEGRLPYDIALETLSEEVFFELDTYWIQVAGQDPAEMVKRYGARVKLLHIKDGPCQKDQPMTAVGQGKMDFPPLIQAAGDAEYLIVELDSCATDMMQAVRDSLDYLAGEGLGERR